MRKLVAGFIAGTLVTVVVMLAILGDGEDGAALSGENGSGQAVADSLAADTQDAERQRRAALSASPAGVTSSRAPGPRTVRLETSRPVESGSADCCPLVVGSDSGDSPKVDEVVVVPLFVEPEPGQGPSRPYLTGKWEGVMTRVGAEDDGSPSAVPPFDNTRDQYGFRLDIRERNLVMYFQSGDQWISLCEGQDLRTNEQGRSAVVITALNAANGGIETMVLNIMRWNEDTIAVHMSRVSGAGPNGGELPPPVNSMGILNRAVF